MLGLSWSPHGAGQAVRRLHSYEVLLESSAILVPRVSYFAHVCAEIQIHKRILSWLSAAMEKQYSGQVHTSRWRVYHGHYEIFHRSLLTLLNWATP